MCLLDLFRLHQTEKEGKKSLTSISEIPQLGLYLVAQDNNCGAQVFRTKDAVPVLVVTCSRSLPVGEGMTGGAVPTPCLSRGSVCYCSSPDSGTVLDCSECNWPCTSTSPLGSISKRGSSRSSQGRASMDSTLSSTSSQKSRSPMTSFQNTKSTCTLKKTPSLSFLKTISAPSLKKTSSMSFLKRTLRPPSNASSPMTSMKDTPSPPSSIAPSTTSTKKPPSKSFLKRNQTFAAHDLPIMTSFRELPLRAPAPTSLKKTASMSFLKRTPNEPTSLPTLLETPSKKRSSSSLRKSPSMSFLKKTPSALSVKKTPSMSSKRSPSSSCLKRAHSTATSASLLSLPVDSPVNEGRSTGSSLHGSRVCIDAKLDKGGHLAVLRLLLSEAVVQKAPRTMVGATPLHDAAALGQLAALRFLLQHTACSLEDRDMEGCTVLHLAAR